MIERFHGGLLEIDEVLEEPPLDIRDIGSPFTDVPIACLEEVSMHFVKYSVNGTFRGQALCADQIGGLVP
jgi:hypothetical protein